MHRQTCLGERRLRVLVGLLNGVVDDFDEAAGLWAGRDDVGHALLNASRRADVNIDPSGSAISRAKNFPSVSPVMRRTSSCSSQP
jgi:ligand-binding sensor protein